MRILRTLSTLALFAALAQSASQPIEVYPGPANIAIGTTRQMSAYVPLSPNTVNWAINGVIGGDSTYGTVSQTGLYTAPAVVPAQNTITIKVTSTADSTKFGTAQVNITKPQTYVWSCYPSSFAAGPVSLSINGSGFVPGAVVTIAGQAVPTTFVNSTTLKVAATIPSNMAGKVPLRAVNPAPGATTSEPVTVTIKVPGVAVAVSPASATVAVTATQQFTATVTGNANTAVTWSATAGSISASGLYTAPASLPNPATAVVKATSVADPLVSTSVNVTLTKPSVVVTVSPASANVSLNQTVQLLASVTNAQNSAVTWTVNNVAGGNATVGTVSSAGLYQAPAALPSPATVTVRAVSVEAPTVNGAVAITVKLPAQVMPNLAHARFLEQAAFGPSPAELQTIGQLGINGWLAQQFAMSETPVVMAQSTSDAAQQYISRLVIAPDQLRQRMVNALAKIIVISANKNIYSNELVPYLQMLSKNAFGNYRTLLGEITVSPQMGKYLDLANSNKAGIAGGTNENYARELMQLFTIGLVKLNQDGTAQVDGQGKTIPTYDQAVVMQTAKALTGWTYPTAAGATPNANNWENFGAASMETRDQNHDKSAKTLAGGCSIPANTAVAQETNLVLDCLFNHPNTGPFIVTRLIRDLVTSNPSSAYIQRVANVWNDNGMGVKGDLRAVLTAILLDAEARQDQATPTQGRLKDATYHVASFIRALNGTLQPANYRAWDLTTMGMQPLAPPSVFGFYAALYRIPGSALAGPEFQIYTPTEAMIRGNFFYSLLTQPSANDLMIDLSGFKAVAADSTALIDKVNATFFYGRMPASMKSSLATVLAQEADNNQKVIAALYLAALSGLNTVQY